MRQLKDAILEWMSAYTPAADLNKSPGLVECRPVFHTVPKSLEADVCILGKVCNRFPAQPATILVMERLQPARLVVYYAAYLFHHRSVPTWLMHNSTAAILFS